MMKRQTPGLMSPHDLAAFKKSAARGVSDEALSLSFDLTIDQVEDLLEKHDREIRQLAQRSTERPKSDLSEMAMRPCLTCRTPFESEHRGNRICPTCKGTHVYREVVSNPQIWPL